LVMIIIITYEPSACSSGLANDLRDPDASHGKHDQQAQ